MRRVFYLFRTGALPPVALGRFTSRRDALRAARDVEALGWRASVLSRLEPGDAVHAGRWLLEYRSPGGRGRARRLRGRETVQFAAARVEGGGI
jgi:hypothetical protein